MIRICHIEDNQEDSGCVTPRNCILVGLFSACPVIQTGDTIAKFSMFSVSQGSSFVHTAS